MNSKPVSKDYIQSKGFKKILFGIGALIIVLLIFQAGVFIGYHRATFSYQFGDNYRQTFGMRGGGLPGGMEMFGGGFSNAHGSIGKIISITLPTLVMEDRDGVEKVILLTDDTVIRYLRDEFKAESLKAGDVVVVIGSPNERAQIEAKFIRVMPPSSGTSFPNVVSTGTPLK